MRAENAPYIFNGILTLGEPRVWLRYLFVVTSACFATEYIHRASECLCIINKELRKLRVRNAELEKKKREAAKREETRSGIQEVQGIKNECCNTIARRISMQCTHIRDNYRKGKVLRQWRAKQFILRRYPNVTWQHTMFFTVNGNAGSRAFSPRQLGGVAFGATRRARWRGGVTRGNILVFVHLETAVLRPFDCDVLPVGGRLLVDFRATVLLNTCSTTNSILN